LSILTAVDLLSQVIDRRQRRGFIIHETAGKSSAAPVLMNFSSSGLIRRGDAVRCTFQWFGA
jgi:hypothetical protein